MNRVRRYQTNRKRSEEVKEKYPVLIGHSVKACKKLYDIGEVADFICEYGVYGEVSVETPSGALLLTTYGIYLDRVSQLADRNGVTLRIFNRLVEPFEQRKILQNAERKNKRQSTGNNVSETIEAQGNLQDVTSLITNMQRSKEILLHCSVFIELKAKSKKKLRELQTDIDMELARSKIKVDKLTLRQKEGYLLQVIAPKYKSALFGKAGGR